MNKIRLAYIVLAALFIMACKEEVTPEEPIQEIPPIEELSIDLDQFYSFTQISNHPNQQIWGGTNIDAIVFNKALWLYGVKQCQSVIPYIQLSHTSGVFWDQVGKFDFGPFSNIDAEVVLFNDVIWFVAGGEVWSSADGKMLEKVDITGDRFEVMENFQLVIFQNALWLLGGQDEAGDYVNKIWKSTDGMEWKEAEISGAIPIMKESRVATFQNKLWLFSNSETDTQINTWSSSDGMFWKKVVVVGDGFPTRFQYTLTTYRGALWAIGGRKSLSWGSEHMNDIWVSEDAISWKKLSVSGSAANRTYFDRRSGHEVVVYQDQLFVIGGTSCDNERRGVWRMDTVASPPPSLIYDGNIRFYSQGELDDFFANNPYETINGSMFITGGVHNLDACISLKEVTGTINFSSGFERTYISSLSGLRNLKKIGGNFEMHEIGGSVGFSGLESLSYIGGGIELLHNEDIKEIQFSALNFLGGSIDVYNSPQLSSFDLGLIDTVSGDFRLRGDFYLDWNCTGLQHIKHVTGDLVLNSKQVACLYSITAVGGSMEVGFDWNGDIDNLINFINLTSIGGNLRIHNMTNLATLEGLENVNFIGGYVEIFRNTNLANYCALSDYISSEDFNGTFVTNRNAYNPALEDLAAGNCSQ